MMNNAKKQEHQRTERLRGWIVLLLYKAYAEGPSELAVLMEALDAMNFPLTRRRLAAELQYLKSIEIPGRERCGLLRVFCLGETQSINHVDQSKLLQRYAQTAGDSEMGCSLAVVLTANGIDFQEHNATASGVLRVE